MLFAKNIYSKGLGTPYAGTEGGKIFQIEANSRVIGLAGAFCAYADDLSGINSNPAGLRDLTMKQMVFNHFDWLNNTLIEYFAYAHPLKQGVIAGSFQYLHIPKFKHYGSYGETLGTIRYADYYFSLGYAHGYKNFNFGGTMKITYQRISENRRKISGLFAFAVDLGFQYKVPEFGWTRLKIKGLRIGLSLLNIGTPAKGDKLPFEIKVGLSAPLYKDYLFFTFDVHKTLYHIRSFADRDYRSAIGLEAKLFDFVYLRTGFKFGYDLNFFTVGIGVSFVFGGLHTKVDYAFSPYKYLGLNNNVALNVKFNKFTFGKPLTEKQAQLVETYYYRGISYFIKEEIEKAIAEWKKILEIDPTNRKAREKIQEAEELLILESK